MTDNVGTYGPYVRNTQRKSPRANFHDYSGGDYFVTICTRDKEHYFGQIVPANVGTHGSCVQEYDMKFTQISKYCHEQLDSLSSHYPYALIPLFVVMPNHLHAIIRIDAPTTDNQRTHEPLTDNQRTHEPCVPTVRTALSVVIGRFKRAVTMFARRNNIDFGWQSRYHDHIIRDAHDGNRIAEYIENNIARWAEDCYNK